MASQLVLIVVGYVVMDQQTPPAEPPWMLVAVLGVVAMGNLVALFAVVPRMFKVDNAGAAMSAFIVRLALAESITIFGMVVLLLGAPWWSPIPFFVLGFSCVATLYPRG